MEKKETDANKMNQKKQQRKRAKIIAKKNNKEKNDLAYEIKQELNKKITAKKAGKNHEKKQSSRFFAHWKILSITTALLLLLLITGKPTAPAAAPFAGGNVGGMRFSNALARAIWTCMWIKQA